MAVLVMSRQCPGGGVQLCLLYICRTAAGSSQKRPTLAILRIPSTQEDPRTLVCSNSETYEATTTVLPVTSESDKLRNNEFRFVGLKAPAKMVVVGVKHIYWLE